MTLVKKKNWRRIYESLARSRWTIHGACAEGAPYEIEGVNVWAQDWTSRKNRPRVYVWHPHDGTVVEAGVYTVKAGERKVHFATGAFSESLFGFYVSRLKRPNKAPEPTTMAVTSRAPSSTRRASHGRGSS